MSPASSSIPRIQLQPPSVDFIDNYLPGHHEAFRHVGISWNEALQEYAPIAMTGKNMSNRSANEQAITPSARSTESSHEGGQETFWGLIFFDAMDSFKIAHPNEPESQAMSGYSIRTQSNWNSINTQLQRAQDVYNGFTSGFRGQFKRAFRKIGDESIDSLQQIVNVVPNVEYVSPVLSAVRILLDVRILNHTVTRFWQLRHVQAFSRS
jgi:hypothetical protein